jgi:hypothetical protein
MSETPSTVVIKGRNELSAVAKAAERDLRKLVQQGELLNRVLRGGAFAGAFVAFTRLAEAAERTAKGFGDGAASLAHFNRELRTATAEAKRLGAALMEEAFGELGFGGQRREIVELERQLANARRRLESYRGGGFTGFLATDSDVQSAIEAVDRYEARLRRLRDNLPYGERSRAPGSRGGGQAAVLTTPGKPGDPMAGLSELNVWQREMFDFNTMANAWADEFSAQVTNQVIRDVNQIANETKAMTMVVKDAEQPLSQMTVFAEEAARNMQGIFANWFMEMDSGFKGLLGSFTNMLRQMVAQLLAQEILTQFFTWGAGQGGWFGSFSKSQLPGRAIGGPVMGGRPYMVGERGPEMFVPGVSGTIIPNAGGAAVYITNNVSVTGETDLQRAMPAILAQANAQAVAQAKSQIRGDIKRYGKIR